jgi:hypothetical protein
MRQRGFVFSLATVLLFIVIVWFAVFYAGKVEREETSILESYAVWKAGFVADDLINDLNVLLGSDVNVWKRQAFTTLWFNDKVGNNVNKLGDVNWNAFVEGNYALYQNAEIGLSLERVLDGKTELVFGNGLVYEHAYNPDENFVQVRKLDGSDTGMLTYDITVYVDGGRLNASVPWPCDAAGDVNVNLRYSDSYGEVEDLLNCRQDSTVSYAYTFDFQGGVGGTLQVRFGNVDGNLNAVRVRNAIENPSITVSTAIKAEMVSPAGELVWYYDGDLNYSQDSVNLNRKFELGRA